MGDAPPNYGYQTDYQERADLVRLWHQTGEEGDPLHYDGGSTDSRWTTDPKSMSPDAVSRRVTHDNIERVYERIMAQKSGNAAKAAGAWGRLHNLLIGMQDTVRKHTDALRDGGSVGKDPKDHYGAWRSPAADAFFARGPGATMKSLGDWAAAAAANQTGLSALADVIDRYQKEMDGLYKQYLAALRAAEAAWDNILHDPKLSPNGGLGSAGEKPREFFIDILKKVRNGDLEGGVNPANPGAAMGHPLGVEEQIWAAIGGNTNWNAKAFDLEYRMAQEYYHTIVNKLGEGHSTRYEGPTNATTVDPKTATDALKNYLAGQLGGPGGGGLGVPSFGVPPAPAMPTFTAPVVPPLPTPDFGKQLGTAEVPDLPKVPGLPGAPAPGTLPAVAGLPPGVVVPPVVPPALGQLAKDAGGLNPSLKSPTSLPNGLFSGVPGANGPLPTGVLNGPASLANQPPLLPPAAGKLSGTDKNAGPKLQQGILGAGTVVPGAPDVGEVDNLAGNPLLPPPAGKLGQNTPAAPLGPTSTGLVEAFTADPSVPTAPPVLARRPPVADPSGLYLGPRADPTAAAPSAAPPGTTPPVLARPRADAELPPPVTPAGERQPAQTAPGYPALPGDSAWVTQPGADVPPVSAPVLDGSARAARAAAADGWRENFVAPPGQPGASAPVLGRPPGGTAQPGGVPSARPGGRPPELSERRLDRAEQVTPTVNEEYEAPVVSDEAAFTVQTPGGPVLANAPRQEFEVEPKPTLGTG